MLSALGGYALKAFLVAAGITTVGIVASRSSTKVAGVLLGMPLGIGPAMILLALAKPAEFVAQSALYGVANVAAALALLAGYVICAGPLGHWLGLAVGAVSWLTVTLFVGSLELTTVSATIVVGAAFLLARLLIARVSLTSPIPVQLSWQLIVLRGLTAGVAVTALVAVAGQLSAATAGLFASFPVYFLSSIWMLASLGGSELARATLGRADVPMLSYVGFCATLHYTCGPLPAFTSFVLAFVLATTISVLIMTWQRSRWKALSG